MCGLCYPESFLIMWIISDKHVNTVRPLQSPGSENNLGDARTSKKLYIDFILPSFSL